MSPHGPLKVITGSSNKALSAEICRRLDIPLGRANVSKFEDGETKVQIEENVRGNDVFLIQSTCPPTNDHLMELLIMIDAAKRASAARITAVIPFFGYARQDRKDQPRVPITAKLVANILTAAGADRILTIDLHSQQTQGFFDIPVDHLSMMPVIYRNVAARNLQNLVVVSPDIGGIKLSNSYAAALRASNAIVGKVRQSDTVTKAETLIGDVAGKTVLIVDDMTETASTITSAAAFLKQHGAGDIYAAVSHAVLGDLAIKRLTGAKDIIKELITTDTTPVRIEEGTVPTTVLSSAGMLADAIQRIHNNMSVTSLFNLGSIKAQ